MDMGAILPLSPSAHTSSPSYRQRWSSPHPPFLAHPFYHFCITLFPVLLPIKQKAPAPIFLCMFPSSISRDSRAARLVGRDQALLRGLGGLRWGEGSATSLDPDPPGLTRTLYWETEMLLGWTVSRTHCFISDANLRGSRDRSQRSFRVHLGGTERHVTQKTTCSSKGPTWRSGPASSSQDVSKLSASRTDLSASCL